MAIAFIQSATALGNATTLSVAVPTGTLDGHFMVAVIDSNTVGATITGPAGWTVDLTTTFGATGTMWIGHKIAGDVEPSSYQWSYSGAANANSGGIDSYSGVDKTNIFDSTSTSGTGVGLTVSWPAIASITFDAWHLTLLVAGSNSNDPSPGGYTHRANTGNSNGSISDSSSGPLGLGHYISGLTGSLSFTTDWVAMSMVLMPSSLSSWPEIDDSTLPVQNFAAKQPEGSWV